MNYIQPTAYILNIKTDQEFSAIENILSTKVAHISDLSCAEQERKELIHALNSLLTALEPDLSLPQYQQKLYLEGVAIPRAKQAISKYGK